MSEARSASDPEQVHASDTAARRAIRDRRARKAVALSTPQGRQDAFERIEAGHVFDLILAPGGDMVKLGMWLGERNAALTEYLEIREQHPELFVLMHQEAQDRRLAASRAEDAKRQGRADRGAQAASA